MPGGLWTKCESPAVRCSSGRTSSRSSNVCGDLRPSLHFARRCERVAADRRTRAAFEELLGRHEVSGDRLELRRPGALRGEARATPDREDRAQSEADHHRHVGKHARARHRGVGGDELQLSSVGPWASSWSARRSRAWRSKRRVERQGSGGDLQRCSGGARMHEGAAVADADGQDLRRTVKRLTTRPVRLLRSR